MKRSLVISLAMMTLSLQSWAARTMMKMDVNTILLGQGISSPAVNTPVNYANGYTHQNSAVAASLHGAELTAEYQTTKDASSNTVNYYGGEFGVGNGKAGLIAGYYKQDCNGCDGAFGGIAGVNFNKLAVGLGYHEKETYTAGFLFNPMGQNKIGLTFDMYNKDSAGNTIKLSTYGAGYTFDAKNWAFAVDASKRDGDNLSQDEKDVIKVTPGLMLHAGFLSVTVDYDLHVNNKNNVAQDQFWGGVGIGNERLQLAVYNKYMGRDWTGSLSVWF